VGHALLALEVLALGSLLGLYWGRWDSLAMVVSSPSALLMFHMPPEARLPPTVLPSFPASVVCRNMSTPLSARQRISL
jgi:hypothetical protein